MTFCAAFKCLKSAYTANMGNPDRIDIISVAEYKSSSLYSESSLRAFLLYLNEMCLFPLMMIVRLWLEPIVRLKKKNFGIEKLKKNL